ncbi:MAG: hypothetical protein MUC92_10895 [Fimbriimonadaceae bacterium]|jgi:hypothetical protein|nr:hypothetical protein [Fimbriimonadaceae bacterium]
MIGSTIATLGLLSMSTPAKSVELTIYNGGFALVKEQRSINLSSGVQNVAIEDVAQMIEANSVSVRNVSGSPFSVLEQNYQYDLISPMAILNKAVGSKVTFTQFAADGTPRRITGTLLSAPTAMVSSPDGQSTPTWNGLVIRSDSGEIILNPTGQIEVASLPEGLISKPTLVWLIEAMQAGQRQIELSYLTQGMGWKVDYVLNLEKDGKGGGFRGWVTLTNNSGATYSDAKLKLLAGEVNRVQPPGRPTAMIMEAAGSARSKGFEQEQFADYHLYTLGRPATVRNREMKQVSLLEAEKVPVTKKLVVDSAATFGMYQPSEGQVGVGPVSALVQVLITNNKESQLGMPLPMGTIKVFQRDSTGSLQLLGEDSIQHTPREETVTLNLGRAFDVVAERKRLSFQWLGTSRRGAREVIEVEVRNRKDTQEQVTILERLWGDFSISGNSQEFTKLDANTIQFLVTLKPNETKKVTFTVETRW